MTLQTGLGGRHFRRVALCLILLAGWAMVLSAPAARAAAAPTVGKWALFEGQLAHPRPPTDAVRGVELSTEFTAPDGKVTRFWGFHDGGVKWRFRFSPDQAGRWRYTARFSDGAAQTSGEFDCAASDLPGPLTRWRENPIWFAAGAGGPVVVRSFHVGDRFFATNFPAATRTAFLDWAQGQGYNLLSVGSHYLNRDTPGRGRGWATPQLWDARAKKVIPGEYARAEAILDDLRARRFYVYPFAGFIGRQSQFPTDPADQEVYIRYTLARFAPYWNVLLNVSGPEPLWKPEGYGNRLSFAEVNRLGELIHRLDPFGRLLSVHNASGDDPFRFSSWGSYSTLQGGPAEKSENFSALHNFVFRNHTGSRPIYAQEVLWSGNSLHGGLTPDQVRRKALVLLFAAATINFADMNGDSSSGYSGTLDPAERHPEMHRAAKSAWDFFAKIPFGRLRPTWDVAKKGVCLEEKDRQYWVYLASGGTTGFASAFPVGWKGEWLAPEGDTPPVAVDASGQKSFDAPKVFSKDVVLHLWRD
ncbi:MAG: DUF5060 domain-containing protein [Cytophagales bacterium]|nr:DUF5060 domain-containing protein [Armatimonadota bacterium]